ncbi:hypothetical protein BSIN_0098 [Burkholderia singularis]|uniref:Uncharacterized protein n=1 Tax=Burkholderia singularis TaxID=1503053 RepID=A0A238H264_9BURK|nr:hypothetical protein BSIN_0098 [Burkholderia singularis]
MPCRNPGIPIEMEDRLLDGARATCCNRAIRHAAGHSFL